MAHISDVRHKGMGNYQPVKHGVNEMSVFEICDDSGKVLARTRVYPVAKSECDKLSREWNVPLKVVEVATVKSTRTVYEAK